MVPELSTAVAHSHWVCKDDFQVMNLDALAFPNIPLPNGGYDHSLPFIRDCLK